MPMVYPQTGPGAGGNPALDGLRQLGSLSGTGSGSTGPLQSHRLSESDYWSYPPAATPPSETSGLQHIINSLKMAGTPKQADQQRDQKQSPIVLHG